MLSPIDYQTIVCELEKSLVAGIETYNQLTLASNILQNGSSISSTRIQTFAGDIVTAAESLYLFDSNFIEVKSFISALNAYIVSSYGSLSSFLVSNSILIPQKVADISSSIGYNIPSSQIGICSNSFSSSSSSSSAIILNVTRLSSTDYVWNFTKDFTNNSFNLEDIAGLVLGTSTLPVSVISVASPLIVLKYPSNSLTTWQTVPPVNIVFVDGSLIDISNGSVE